jgi:hypothetical protein
LLVAAAARDQRRPHDWTTLCAEYVDAAAATNKSVTVLRLEVQGVRGMLEILADRHGYPVTVADKHINRAADRFEEPWERLWTAAALKAVGDRLAPDLALCAYDKPKAVRHVPAR